MTPYYVDPWLSVFHGDCREVMAGMEPESVHCVVTSPPYWGLRDYGTATWVGGESGCDHRQAGTHVGPKSTLRNDGRDHKGPYEGEKAITEGLPFRTECGKCGAIRQDSQLGLEPTPEEYVANLVAVFREVKRVLRKDGTVWLNLGDSYASGEIGRHDGYNPTRANGTGTGKPFGPRQQSKPLTGLKPKDLVGIPWRVAFALQADGWYLRSDIIWAKPNPMPESVTDRPTKSHEYIFLLSRSPRYYFDADAVREDAEYRGPNSPESIKSPYGQGYTRRGKALTSPRQDGNSWNEANGRGFLPTTPGRNIRSVWTMATQPYPGSHFATFPEQLPERCIKAGTSEKGVCPECGAPWERVATSHIEYSQAIHNGTKYGGVGQFGNMAANRHRDGHVPGHKVTETTGWRSSCKHTADPVPAIVLDPFAGSGTTGMVAQSLSRRAVLIDLSLDYLGQLMARNADIPLGLTS